MVSGSIKYILSLIAAPLAAWFTLHALWGVWGVWWPVYSTLEFVYNTSIACFRYEPLFMVPWAYAAAQEIAQYPVYKSWYGLLTLLGSIGGFGGVLIGLDKLFPEDPVSKAAQNGMCRLSFKTFVKRFNQKKKISTKNGQWEPGIKVHPELQLSLKEECQHFLILGSTGASKTLGHINSIILQAAKRGDKLIVFDVKGDMQKKLMGRPGVYLFAPWDRRSLRWNLQEEIQQANECDVLAEAFIPIDTKNAHAEEFNRLARQVLSATMKCLWFEGRLHWEDLKDCLYDIDMLTGFEEKNGTQVLGLLERYEVGLPALATLRETASGGQTQAVESMLQENIGKYIWDMCKAWKEQCDFTLHDWIRNGKGILILRYSKHFKELSKSICSTACSVAIDRVLKLPEGDAKIWFVMDEMANFPRISNLKDGLSLARDRGARFVICTQIFMQIIDMYGPEIAETLMDQCATSIFMSQNSSKAAKFVSEMLGEGEVLIKKANVQDQGSNALGNAKRSTSYDMKVDKLVKENEIRGLRHAQHIKGGGSESFLRIASTGAITKMTKKLTHIPTPKGALDDEACFSDWVWEKDKPIKQEVL